MFKIVSTHRIWFMGFYHWLNLGDAKLELTTHQSVEAVNESVSRYIITRSNNLDFISEPAASMLAGLREISNPR
jgi:hypothetical protein